MSDFNCEKPVKKLSETEQVQLEPAGIVLSKEQFAWVMQLLDAPTDPAPNLREAVRSSSVWKV